MNVVKLIIVLVYLTGRNSSSYYYHDYYVLISDLQVFLNVLEKQQNYKQENKITNNTKNLEVHLDPICLEQWPNLASECTELKKKTLSTSHSNCRLNKVCIGLLVNTDYHAWELMCV